MAESAELKELLDRLKGMEPKGAAKAARQGAPKGSNKRELYNRILELAKDVRSREDGVDEDIKKIAALVRELESR